MERLDREVRMVLQTEDRPIEREELLVAVREVDAMLCLVTDTIDEEVLEEGAGLRVVANVATGYNNIDIAAATRRGIPVTNTPDVLTDTTADLAFGLMLATARRILEGDIWARSGAWPGWGPLQLLGRDVSGATLGLVGLGRIGRAMVPRAKGFSMKVLYWNRTRLEPEDERALGVAFCELDELFEVSDFVSLHCAYTQDTHHLVAQERLSRMKPDAFLINTARGPVVDEEALAFALEQGSLAGAGLDVFEAEPMIHPGLVGLPNVVLLLHIGSASHATRERMADLAIDNVLAACRGERPPNVINPEVLRRRGGLHLVPDAE